MFLKVAVARPREDQPEIPVFFPWRKKDYLVGVGGNVYRSALILVIFFKKKKKKAGDDQGNLQ